MERAVRDPGARKRAERSGVMGKGLGSENWERDLKSEVMKSGVKNNRSQWKPWENREWGWGRLGDQER